jgi:hypothetical protein
LKFGIDDTFVSSVREEVSVTLIDFWSSLMVKSCMPRDEETAVDTTMNLPVEVTQRNVDATPAQNRVARRSPAYWRVIARQAEYLSAKGDPRNNNS